MQILPPACTPPVTCLPVFLPALIPIIRSDKAARFVRLSLLRHILLVLISSACYPHLKCTVVCFHFSNKPLYFSSIRALHGFKSIYKLPFHVSSLLEQYLHVLQNLIVLRRREEEQMYKRQAEPNK